MRPHPPHRPTGLPATNIVLRMRKYLNQEYTEVMLGIIWVTFLIQFARLLLHSPYRFF